MYSCLHSWADWQAAACFPPPSQIRSADIFWAPPFSRLNAVWLSRQHIWGLGRRAEPGREEEEKICSPLGHRWRRRAHLRAPCSAEEASNWICWRETGEPSLGADRCLSHMHARILLMFAQVTSFKFPGVQKKKEWILNWKIWLDLMKTMQLAINSSNGQRLSKWTSRFSRIFFFFSKYFMVSGLPIQKTRHADKLSHIASWGKHCAIAAHFQGTDGERCLENSVE